LAALAVLAPEIVAVARAREESVQIVPAVASEVPVVAAILVITLFVTMLLVAMPVGIGLVVARVRGRLIEAVSGETALAIAASQVAADLAQAATLSAVVDLAAVPLDRRAIAAATAWAAADSVAAEVAAVSVAAEVAAAVAVVVGADDRARH
jgi:hypothetical protein